MNTGRFLAAGVRLLAGMPPMLSIEITRECPLHCPGCHAYEDGHLGGGVTLRQLRDLRGDDLVDGVLGLVATHRPVHLSIVGGEPLIRHRELSRILPTLSAKRVETLVVTSGVIPIPSEWNGLRHVRIAVSLDGLREHHDVRRTPATFERVLQNISGRRVDISWVITRPLFVTPGIAAAFATPPANPRDCIFSRVSINYSADLQTDIQPCFFGGEPDCRQCGCAVSAGLHWVERKRILGPIRASHVMNASIAVGHIVSTARLGRL